MTKSLVLTSIEYRSLYRYLIGIDPRLFAICGVSLILRIKCMEMYCYLVESELFYFHMYTWTLARTYYYGNYFTICDSSSALFHIIYLCHYTVNVLIRCISTLRLSFRFVLFIHCKLMWTPLSRWYVNVLGVVVYGPLARYVKLRVAHAPGMPGAFSPRPTSKETAN